MEVELAGREAGEVGVLYEPSGLRTVVVLVINQSFIDSANISKEVVFKELSV